MKKVTKEDLKGDIADFPLKVVQWMCEQQVKQGNEFNPKVFQDHNATSILEGGFYWANYGDYFFCEEVIWKKNFDLFFERHPKKDTNTTLQEVTQSIRNLNKTAPSYRNELVNILKKYGNDQQFEGYQRGVKDAKKAIDNITPDAL